MKKIIYTLFFYLFISLNSSSSFESNPDTNDIGTGGREDLSFLNPKTSNFKKGNSTLNKAIKLLKKKQYEKANIRLEKSLKYLILANQETPENIQILSLLGLNFYLVGDIIMSEIYYQEGLSIDPNNQIINRRLGELYSNTKRLDLAKERLKILSNCNCEEYLELKKIIFEAKKF